MDTIIASIFAVISVMVLVVGLVRQNADYEIMERM